MGACADREVYFERESVKELRAKMVIEYLKNTEGDVKNTRSTSTGPMRRSLKSKKNPRRTQHRDIDLESLDSRRSDKNPKLMKNNFELDLHDLDSPTSKKGILNKDSQDHKDLLNNLPLEKEKIFLSIQDDTEEHKIDKNSPFNNQNLNRNEEKTSKKVPSTLDLDKSKRIGEPLKTEGSEGLDKNKQKVKKIIKPEDILFTPFKIKVPESNEKKNALNQIPLITLKLDEEDKKDSKIPAMIKADISGERVSESVEASLGKSVFGSKGPGFDYKDESLKKSSEKSLVNSSQNIENQSLTSKICLFPSKETSPFSEKMRESVVSLELERQAIGVSLPPLKPPELKITPGLSQSIIPGRVSLLVEGPAFFDENSPIKFFKIQVPYAVSQAPSDFEPFHPVIISKNFVIKDYGNRPASPKVEKKNPKFRFLATPMIDNYDDSIPIIPICDLRLSNPFDMAESLTSFPENKAIEVYAENPQDEKEMLVNEEEIIIPDNELFFGDNLQQELLSEKNEEEKERYGADNEIALTSPENLVMTPEIDFFARFSIPEYSPRPGVQDTEYEDDPNFIPLFTRAGVPEYEDDYNRNSSPLYLPNIRSESPDLNSNYNSFLMDSKRNSHLLVPNIKVFGEEGSPGMLNDSVNIPDIRASLNGSGIFFKRSREHLLRRSPRKLSPEQFKKNLEGKLTAEEELLHSPNR
ncbi:hypothetical protein SteCoe_22571 [Stentor coeruleus]|uniref:Uncharacterized protein n=1 Tax=Stentor coeruleus TaxID=5963 RepID=A0A1R2BM24_9CILI|nr:hypothetical protein SteCoe_22571 [Stentor coeruleus]